MTCHSEAEGSEAKICFRLRPKAAPWVVGKYRITAFHDVKTPRQAEGDQIEETLKQGLGCEAGKYAKIRFS